KDFRPASPGSTSTRRALDGSSGPLTGGREAGEALGLEDPIGRQRDYPDGCCDGRIESVIRTRRQWLQAATMLPACLALRAARNEFWNSKDPGSWSNDEKQFLLGQSPWAREGFVRMEEEKNRRATIGYGNNGRPGADMPDTRP